MRKLPIVSGVFVAGALAVAACGGTPAASKLPTVPPVPSIPAVSIPPLPSVALPSLGIPNGSFTLPSFAIPSFTTNADPALAAQFPQTISGQQVTGIQTYSFAEFLAFITQEDPTAAQQWNSALSGAGINPATVTYGSGNVTLNEDDITIQAFHTPGATAGNLVSVFVQLAQQGGSQESPPTITQANVGGKAIAKVTTTEGDVSYVYANNDVLWSIDGASDDTEAGTILQALP